MQMGAQLHAQATCPRGRNGGTRWLGGCVGPRAALEKRKILHCRELNPGRQAHSEQGDSEFIKPTTV
jgi:hypothetical protein